MRLKVAVCDDEKIICNEIKKRLLEVRPEFEVSLFSSGDELIKSDKNFDLIFLDIEMPQLDGMETAKVIRKNHKNEYIIFLTSHSELMVEAFKVKAFRFLEKPIELNTFREVLPFDYLESAAFFPDYSEEEKLIAYGILGGVPRYLNAFDPKRALRENLISEILTEGAFLNDEPQTLLRMELREPAVYNSILEAVANGCNRIMEIADRIHEEKSKCSKYMLTLQTLRLLEKHVPCGETDGSKKGIYEITDHFYRFWYRYVFSNKSYYSMLGTERAADEIMEGINDYMGPVFEDICRQYLVRRAKGGILPFVPHSIGKWWGNNPVIKAQDDVDLLALDRKGERGIFVECKFRNRPMGMDEYDDLVTATEAFPGVKEKWLIFISKSGFTEAVKRRAGEEGAELVEVKGMYE